MTISLPTTLSDTALVALLAACFAFLSAVVAAVVSLWVSARTRYINAVTVQRSEWIERLRTNLAKFSGAALTLHYKFVEQDGPDKSEEYLRLIRELNDLIPLVRLQLNPRGNIEQNMIAILLRVPRLTEKKDAKKLLTADDLMIRHSQWLLKAEWEKVKYEAGSCVYKLWCALIKNRLYSWRYRRFCKCAGNLSAFLGDG